MGWIAGILSFVIITVLFTIGAVALANQPGGLPQFFRDHSSSAIPSEDMEKAIQFLSNPLEQALVYLFFLFFWFTVIAVCCTAGGALGAKVLDKE